MKTWSWSIVAALTVFASAMILANQHHRAASAPRHDGAASRQATPTGVPGVSIASSQAATSVSRPASLTIPSLGVRTALPPLGLQSDGSLQAPPRWDTAGWYDDGVAPGEVGPAIVVGHIDSTRGPAVFYRLRDLAIGAQVVITDLDGAVLTFVVDTSETFAKDVFPSADVYGPTPDAELKLITCTGTFDSSARSYRSNLVVTAHLAART